MNTETVIEQQVEQQEQDVAPSMPPVPTPEPETPEVQTPETPEAEATPEEQTPEAMPENMDEYLTQGYDYQAPKRGDLRDGIVVEINEQGLVVDIGFKREGLVPADDLRRLDKETRESINVGDTITAVVLRTEDAEGHPILSIHQARLQEDWRRAEELMKSGELYEGEVAGYNRGGLIVRFGKIRGFVPTSQVVGMPRRLREEQRRQRLAAMVGKPIGLKVIEVDRSRRRLIFSQRRALREWQELQRERVLADLKEGEIRHGKVSSITKFGAFVDLGGADGLIHISELSWGKVANPREVLKVGDEVDVYVLEVDREQKRIALSLKKLQPDPWEMAAKRYKEGQLVEGRITRVLDFGAFVELEPGVEGLLHASEMIGTPDLAPSEIVHPGEKLLVKVLRINVNRRRLALSARRVRQDEWERWVAGQQVAEHARAEEAEKEAEKEAQKEAQAAEPVEEETAVETPEAEEVPAVESVAEPAAEPAAEASPEPAAEVASEAAEPVAEAVEEVESEPAAVAEPA